MSKISEVKVWLREKFQYDSSGTSHSVNLLLDDHDRLSHAPVMDAQKLSWAIKEAGHISIFEVDKVADIITDNIELDITQVKGEKAIDLLKRYSEMVEDYITLSSHIPLDMPEYKEEAELISEVGKIISEHERIVTGGKG